MREIRFIRDVGAIRRKARVSELGIAAVRSYLVDAPGGLDESPRAAAVVEILDAAIERNDESGRWVFSDDAADAVHWALERMMADGRELSKELHDLRDVVASA